MTEDSHHSPKDLVAELSFLWRTYGVARPQTLTTKARKLRNDVRRHVMRFAREVSRSS